MVTLATMKARLARLEERRQPGAALPRFVIVTSDDEADPGPDDEVQLVFRFTIRLDRPGSNEEEPGA